MQGRCLMFFLFFSLLHSTKCACLYARENEKDEPWTVKWNIFLKESVFSSLFLCNIYLFPLFNGSCLFFSKWKCRMHGPILLWAESKMIHVKEKDPEGTSDNSDYFQRRATVATFEVNSGLCESCLSWACNIDFSIYTMKYFFLAQGSVTKKKIKL